MTGPADASGERDLPALLGGRPVRETPLPYARQEITAADREAVAAVLASEWLTTGPAVTEFEDALAAAADVRFAVAFSNGTTALQGMLAACGIGPGDEVVVPTLTFVATANAVLQQGARPVFADVDPHTLRLSPEMLAPCLTPRTKAVLAVDFGGEPCDADALRSLLEPAGIPLLFDACHSLGGSLRGRKVGSLGKASAFSFHAVKPLTTGEGGAVTTDDEALVPRLKRFRNHGLDRDFRERQQGNSWEYRLAELGWNCRLTDLQAALGRSQLRRLEAMRAARDRIAGVYLRELAELPELDLPPVNESCVSARHLFVVRLRLDRLTADRGTLFKAMRAEGIGVNVHYFPVHLQPLYRERCGTAPGDCPHAEAAYERLLTLPLFSAMTAADAADTIAALRKVLRWWRR